MDSVDEKIISELRENARASFTDIAEKVEVSEGTVRNRVKQLQEEEIIEKFTVELADKSQISAFVSVDISTQRTFEQVLDDFPRDLEIFELAGDMDLLVKLDRQSSSEINQVVDSIRSVEGVKDTKTYMILSERS